MANTLSNMGLKQWNLSDDRFAYIELADNFAAIDQHDHTVGHGVQIPSAGLASGAVTNAKLASGAVDSTKILSGTIQDSNLRSPNNPVFRTLARTETLVPGGTTAGTYLLGHNVPVAVGGDVVVDPPVLIAITGTTLQVPHASTTFTITAVCATNTVAPAATLAVSLYPISSVAGGSGANRWNVGAPVGVSAAFTTPGSSSLTSATSGGFSVADGIYAIGVSVSATAAANSATALSASLDVHHVVAASPPPPSPGDP